jgi:hypothetical protein
MGKGLRTYLVAQFDSPAHLEFVFAQLQSPVR